MKRLVVPIPPSWQQPNPQILEYVLAPGVVVTLSNVQGLPEDPPTWMTTELRRRAGAAPTALERTTTTGGWPMLIGEATGADAAIMLVMYQFLEWGAVASLRAPTALYAAHRAQAHEVLTAVQIAWGDPPVTVAALFAGAAPMVRSSDEPPAP